MVELKAKQDIRRQGKSNKGDVSWVSKKRLSVRYRR